VRRRRIDFIVTTVMAMMDMGMGMEAEKGITRAAAV